jgi:hypothetical protein
MIKTVPVAILLFVMSALFSPGSGGRLDTDAKTPLAVTTLEVVGTPEARWDPAKWWKDHGVSGGNMEAQETQPSAEQVTRCADRTDSQPNDQATTL